jgi:hypothetical protein
MNPEFLFKYLLMIGLVIILMFICSLIGWLILSKIVLEVDTRIAKAELHWRGIGSVKVWYEDEWWLNINTLFYHKTIRFVEMRARFHKAKRRKVRRGSNRFKMIRILRKSIRVIQSFRVIEWQLAVDTGDFSSNGRFYYLNFLKPTFGHLHVNFSDENFLVLKIYNYPWKMLYAFMR